MKVKANYKELKGAKWTFGKFLAYTLSVVILAEILINSLNHYIEWNKEKYKEVNISVSDIGHIGKPTCSVKIDMNYGTNDIHRALLGYSVYVYSNQKANAPLLFGFTPFDYSYGKDRYREEYDAINSKYPKKAPRISTIIKTTIETSSTFYDKIITSNFDSLIESDEVIIRQKGAYSNNNSKLNTWFYLSRDTKKKEGNILYSNSNIDIDCHTPRWYQKGNLSKLHFKYRFRGNHIPCDTLIFNFYSPYTLYSISEKPDIMNYSTFMYTDPRKLKNIMSNGLQFYSTFPMSEGLQQTRISLLLLVIPLLLSAIVYMLKQISRRKNLDAIRLLWKQLMIYIQYRKRAKRKRKKTKTKNTKA